MFSPNSVKLFVAVVFGWFAAKYPHAGAILSSVMAWMAFIAAYDTYKDLKSLKSETESIYIKTLQCLNSNTESIFIKTQDGVINMSGEGIRFSVKEEPQDDPVSGSDQ